MVGGCCPGLKLDGHQAVCEGAASSVNRAKGAFADPRPHPVVHADYLRLIVVPVMDLSMRTALI